LRLGKGKPNMRITSKQHDFKGNVNTVISHHQHLGKSFPNILPKIQIAKMDSKFKSNIG
jgi:hypothetical protein